jgi:hypothetical protein
VVWRGLTENLSSLFECFSLKVSLRSAAFCARAT